MEIHAGDFPKKTQLVVSGNHARLALPWQAGDGWGSGQKVELTKATVAELAIANEESVKKFGRAAGLGLVGGLVLGPAGLIAGALVGGRKKNVTFILELVDGRRMLATVDSSTFTKLQGALF